MIKANPRIGFIGFGEVGSNISKGLKNAGVNKITAYDEGLKIKPPYPEAFKQKARSVGVELATTMAELAKNSDLIISVIYPKGALATAKKMAQFLTPSHLYVDLNACSPQVKQESWAYFKERGLRYVDGGIMGVPGNEQQRAQIFAAGDGAEEFRDMMGKYGMEIRVISNKAGDATRLKMIHSVISKGLNALLLESFLALYKAGLDPKEYDGLRNWASESGLLKRADRMIGHSAIHAGRRSGEMEYVADTLRSLNIEPIMTEATIKRLEWLASFNLPDYFPDRFPSGYKEVFEALDKIKERKGKE